MGTWKTPAEIVPENHLDAWKLSRENLQRGSDEAMKKFEQETILSKMMALVQDVPIAAYQKAIGLEERKKSIRSLLLEYRQQLIEAAEFMKAKGEAIPLNIQQAITHIDSILGLHWVGGT